MEAEAMEAAQARSGEGLLRKPAADYAACSQLESVIETMMKGCEHLRARKRFFANKVEETNASGSPPRGSPAPPGGSPAPPGGSSPPLGVSPAYQTSNPSAQHPTPQDPPAQPPSGQGPLSEAPHQQPSASTNGRFQPSLTQAEFEASGLDQDAPRAQHAQHDQDQAVHRAPHHHADPGASLRAAEATEQPEQASCTTWEAGVRAESGIALAVGSWAHTSSTLPNQSHRVVNLTSSQQHLPVAVEQGTDAAEGLPEQIPSSHVDGGDECPECTVTLAAQAAHAQSEFETSTGPGPAQANGMAENPQESQNLPVQQRHVPDGTDAAADPPTDVNPGEAAVVAAAAVDAANGDDDDIPGSSGGLQVIVLMH